MKFLRQLRALFQKGKLDAEMAEEMRTHVELQTERNLKAGLPPEDARYAALRQFGNVAAIQEQAREARGWIWSEQGMQDLRYAWRQLARTPGFSVVAIVTLALGLGANTAVFSVVNAVLLRPAGYPEPDRIVVVRSTQLPAVTDANFSVPDYLDCQAEARSVTALAASFNSSASLTGLGDPQSLIFTRTTANYFSVFGVQPVLGRGFSAAEDAAGGTRVVVLSHGFWQRQLGGRADVLGRAVVLGGKLHTVVGVMPAAFHPAGTGEVWVPMAFTNAERSGVSRGARGYSVVGRLASGVTVAQAETELSALMRRLEIQHPDFNRGWGVRVAALADYSVSSVRSLLWILFGAVACVQLVVCTNVANLLLARANGRTAEMAVRAALGASRARIARQLLVEGLLLAGLGALLGVFLARWGVAALRVVLPTDLVAASAIHNDGIVIAFVLGITVLTGLAFGFAPLWSVGRTDPHESLRAGFRGATGPGSRRRLGHALVVAEVVVALVLLYGGGLLVRTVVALTSVDPGFNPQQAYWMRLVLPEGKYAGHEQRAGFARQLLDQLTALPGVEAAGVAHALPMAGNWLVDFAIADRPLSAGGKPKTSFYAVTPGYFPAMGLRLRRGRVFTERDDEQAAPVVVINETFARQFFPNEDPLGRRIYLMKGPEKYGEIVGIVADVKQAGPDRSSAPQAYEPFAQWSFGTLEVVVRTSPAAGVLPATLRAQVYAVDKDQPVSSLRPLSQLVGDAMARQRAAMALVTIFSAVALVIAVIGIYGVVAYTVSRRTREFGLRLALGARPGDLVRQVLLEGGRWVGVGLALGLVAAMGAARVLESLLFGTTPHDWSVLALIAGIFGGVALLACWLPARRAAKVDPLVALRAE